MKTIKKVKLYPEIIKAELIKRDNRFIARVNINGKTEKAHVPSTGKMAELFLPQACVYLTPAENQNRKTKYTLVATKRHDKPRIIDSQKANIIFTELFNVMPGFESFTIQTAEYSFEDSRLDFLLEGENNKALVEVKTCTLLENGLAAFPDAVSKRAVKHVNTLANAQNYGYEPYLVFLICGKADYFIPDYYTDINFYNIFMEKFNKINVLAFSYEIDEKLTIYKNVKSVEIPYEKLKSLNLNTGSYITLYRLFENEKIKIGKNKVLNFSPGFHLYTGSAMNSLWARTERHKKNVKNKKWHVDFLHPPMKHVKTYTFNALDIECSLAQNLQKIFEPVPYFGSSDCKCPSHLFYSKSPPEENADFINALFSFRFNSSYFD